MKLFVFEKRMRFVGIVEFELLCWETSKYLKGGQKLECALPEDPQENEFFP